MPSNLKEPPHSAESESCFLGSLVFDPSIVKEAKAELPVESLWFARNKIVYRAILKICDDNRALDLVTLKDEISLAGKLADIGGVEYVGSLIETLPSAAHWKEYATAIKRFAHRRKLLTLSTQVATKAESGSDLNGEIDELVVAAKSGVAGSIKKAEFAVDLLAAKIPQLDYLLEPLLVRGRLTMIQGEPKGGKSCFALLAAIAASVGVWPAGRWTASGRARHGLFLTYEDDRGLIQERLRQYTLGMAEPFQSIVPSHLRVYCDESAPLMLMETPEGSATLRRILEEHEAEFLVIDTFSHVTAADENLKKEMQPVMNALNLIARELKVAILLIHHTGKPPKDGKGGSMVYRSRGSSAIPAGFHAILHWGENEADVTKCRFVSKRGHKDNFVVRYIRDGDEIVRWQLADAEEEADKYGNRKAILEALAKLIVDHPEGVSRLQVAKESKISRNTVASHLDTLSSEGSIQSRQFDNPSGGGRIWVYAPVTHLFPPLSTTLPPLSTTQPPLSTTQNSPIKP